MTLDALETSMKFDDFSGLPRGVPDPAPRLLGGNAMLFGLQSKIIRPRLDLQTLSTFDLQAPNTLRLRNQTLNTLEYWNSRGGPSQPGTQGAGGLRSTKWLGNVVAFCRSFSGPFVSH